MAVNKAQVLLSFLDKVSGPLKKIQDNLFGTIRELTAAQASLRTLNRAQSDISAWNTQSAAARNTAEAMRDAQTRVSGLAQQMANAGQPTRAMTADFQAAVRGSDALTHRYEQQQNALRQLQNRLNGAGVDTRNLGKAESTLQALIAAGNDRVKTSGERLAQQREKLNRVGEAGLNVAGMAKRPLMAAVKSLLPHEGSALQLQASMKLSDGSVPEDFQRLTDLATRLGEQLPGSSADYLDMMTVLQRQGLSARSILDGTAEAAGYLGVQLRMPADAAGQFAARMQAATRASGADMMGLMDVVQRVDNMGLGSDDLLQGFTRMAPAMDLIKQRGGEAANSLAPLLVMLNEAEVSGESAGVAISEVFQAGLDTKRLAEANKLLKATKAGFSMDFSDGSGGFGGIDTLLAQLQKLKTLDATARVPVMASLFGDDQETLKAAEALMNQGTAGYQQVIARMQVQADLRQRVNGQLESVSNAMEGARDSYNDVLSALGETAKPELISLLKTFSALAASVRAWIEENPTLAKSLVWVVAVIGLVAGALGGVALGVSKLLGAFATLRVVWSVIAGGMALMSSPVLLIVAAVAALAAGAYLLYSNWGAVSNFFTNLWQSVLTSLNSFWNEVKAAFAGGVGGILTILTNFSPLGLFYTAFASVLNYLGLELPIRFSEAGGMLMDGLVNGIKAKFSAVKDAITSAAGSAIDWFKEKMEIHSPSRVFAQLGDFTMQGFVTGLENADGPLGMRGVGSGIRFDSRPPLSASQAAGYSSQDTYQIQINVGANGDAQGVAQAVRAELMRIEAERAARRRSRLTDQD
ncbi:phage tail tape measure protein [Pseudomonas mangiferae]|uniref:Phage tail tape measure protein n=1 Tax=Pseudomonas mangiferae TaxID=2593654 RepID=A0A553H0K8_9PSED|nr:phage tail tape measure protein [Pseudomonas mangiferae]TRX75286.1 phage tail tape measure protein [Pseudomonas mangiferae]